MLFQSETEIELGSLLRQDYQGLHNELLLRLGEHYQQVGSCRPVSVRPANCRFYETTTSVSNCFFYDCL